jgi:predicted DNA-binding ribbon-helix-helix protein
MKRTAIFAEESMLKVLQEIARKERLSLGATIRRALEEFIGRHEGAGRLPSFLGIGRSGRKDIAERAEELLWAVPRSRA